MTLKEITEKLKIQMLNLIKRLDIRGITVNFATNLIFILEMTKKNFEKILKNDILNVSDLTVEEKKALYARMEELGMSQSTAYLRFFSKGFDRWEIEGITHTKNEFLLTETPETMKEGERKGDVGYEYVLSLNIADEPGAFYKFCQERVLCNKLVDFMFTRGMSQGTTRARFREDNWKPWEVMGIKAILEEFIKQ